MNQIWFVAIFYVNKVCYLFNQTEVSSDLVYDVKGIPC